MPSVWLYSLVSVFIVSVVSLVGIMTIAIKQAYIKRILLFFVSFAAGALLGNVFIHLLPELVEKGAFGLSTSLYILLGMLIFFVLEKFLHWRHCHLSATPGHVHPLAQMNLVGDAVHNFTDGMVIAGSFLVSVPVGISTTVAVILHEIPQEMGDFGVLLHAGMSVKKALFFNFITALTAILGAVFVLVIPLTAQLVLEYVIPLVIGGFLYIASADLIPEMHKDAKPLNSVLQLISLLAGVGIMFLLLAL